MDLVDEVFRSMQDTCIKCTTRKNEAVLRVLGVCTVVKRYFGSRTEVAVEKGTLGGPG